MPCAMMKSQPAASAASASSSVPTCHDASAPASWTRRTSDGLGSPQKKSMTRAWRSASAKISSSKYGMSRLMPNGREVSARTRASRSSAISTGTPAKVNCPSPPALLTAAASSGDRIEPIPASCSGTRSPSSRVNVVSISEPPARTLALRAKRAQERDELVDLLRRKRARERRHVVAAVQDARGHLIRREPIADGGEVGSGEAAAALKRVAGEAAMPREERRPGRLLRVQAGCHRDRKGAVLDRIDVRRPRRDVSGDEEHGTGDETDAHRRDGPRPLRPVALAAIRHERHGEEEDADRDGQSEEDDVLDLWRDERQEREERQEIPIR